MEVYIYGEIGSNGVTLKSISDQIKGAEQVTVHINSPGGEVFEGIAISNIIKSIPNSVAVIEGLCASIATVVASSCKVVKMYPNAQYMVHNAWVGAEGNKNDLKKQVELLSVMDSQIMETYTSKTNLTVNELQPLMDAETWMTAEEAKAKGFIDEIIEQEYKAVAKVNFNDMKFLDSIKNILTGVKNMVELKLADGKSVMIEAEPGAEVGAAVMVEGQPAPVGEHPLEDGRVLVVVEAGKVAEIKSAEAKKDPMEERFNQLEAAVKQIAATLGAFGNVEKKIEDKLTSEITALKAQITTGHRPDKKKVEGVGKLNKEIKVEDIQKAKASGNVDLFKQLYLEKYGVEPKV